MKWNKINKLPSNNRWVLGKCEILLSLEKFEPVIFQIKYENGKWCDWCGDNEKSGEWKVIYWIDIPKTKVKSDNISIWRVKDILHQHLLYDDVDTIMKDIEDCPDYLQYNRIICAPCNKDMRLIKKSNNGWYIYICDECMQIIKLHKDKEE